MTVADAPVSAPPTAEHKVFCVETVLAMWDKDSREHLNTFGQHMPVSLECVADHIRSALKGVTP